MKGGIWLIAYSCQCLSEKLNLSPLMTKPKKWHVHSGKIQISLGVHPVWSESSLSTWRIIGSLATHKANSEDWSDWVDAQADLWLVGCVEV